MKVIATVPPYAEYAEDIAKDDYVSGIRFNTVFPLSESKERAIRRMNKRVYPKDLWIDLKCRQLRITHSSLVPYHTVKISHKIKVDTPVEAWFDGGKYLAKISKVDGNKLFVEEGPFLALGPGMPINILDPSLEIEGYLTKRDIAYIKAAKKADVHNYMLSYVEKESDIEDLLELDPDARIIAKIESAEGLEFINWVYPKYRKDVRLMAARGDLYVELDNKPHRILNALKKIRKADSKAIAASRIFSSFKDPENPPECVEICDMGYLIEVGYKEFMFGDEVAFNEDSIKSALGLFRSIAKDYGERKWRKKKR
ncbi:MAG: pyruvate kinase [Candidatus Aenigmatarchaeota archaeon]